MKNIIAAVLLLLVANVLHAERVEYYFKTGWRFSRTDDAAQALADYDDSRWQTVRVPHDWAIYGPFAKNNDTQQVAI